MEERPPWELHVWGVTASAEEAVLRQRSNSAELSHLSPLLSSSAGSLSVESAGVSFWRQSSK